MRHGGYRVLALALILTMAGTLSGQDQTNNATNNASTTGNSRTTDAQPADANPRNPASATNEANAALPPDGATGQATRKPPPFSELVVEADAELTAQRVNAWQVGDVHFALLDGDVTIDIGAYGFRADRAAVRIVTERSGGKRVRHLAIYLDNARTRGGGGAIAASGPRVLVTASTVGQVEVAADLWRNESAADDPLVVAAHERLKRYLADRGKPELSIDDTGKPVTPPIAPPVGPPDQPVPPGGADAGQPKPEPFLAEAPSNQAWDAPPASGEATFVPGRIEGDPALTLRKTALKRAPLHIDATTDARQIVLASGDQSFALPLPADRDSHRVTLDGNPLQPTLSLNGAALVNLRAAWTKLMLDEAAPHVTVTFTGATKSELAFSGAAAEAWRRAHGGAPRADGDERDPRDAPPRERIFPANGVISFNADKIVYDKGESEGEAYLSLVGQVRVMYQDIDGRTNMSLRAENAVLFLSNVSQAEALGGRTEAADVRGIYLENNVIATDGEYTVRAPRAYYDVEENRAILLEAVMYTWDVRRQIPLYVRASLLRQESRKSWSGGRTLVTTSEFAEPHVAIAADRVTFWQVEQADGPTLNRFRADDITVEVGGVPVLWAPMASGQANDLPLRRFSARYGSRNGPEVFTRWDMFAILNRQKPENVELDGIVDYRGEHGPAVGLNLQYEQQRFLGEMEAYLVLLDEGTDNLGNSRERVHDGDTRGYIDWLHRHYLRDNWELTLELGIVSDPTFLEEFFSDEFEEAKDYETSLYLKKQEEDTAFSLLAQINVNDFTPQAPTLQAPGYTVEKLPEFAYYTVGRNLWDNRLTYFGELRVSRMRLLPGEDSPSNRGFNDFTSAAVFGIPMAGTPFDTAARAAGLSTQHVHRLDTRHEIDAPMKLGILNVTPFASGRITAYDDDFNEFAGNNDNVRLFGTLGARIHTELSRVYDNLHSRVLNVNRLRHIVEPSVDVSYAGSTIDPEDIPVYDQHVEGVTEGYTVRLGLRNTLQTQRGGEGRWRSVDWITLDTDLVFRGDDADLVTPIPRYFSFRPEYSRGGDHFYSRLMWLVSDSLAAVGEITYSFESDRTEQWRVGGSYRASDDLTWYLDYDELRPLNSQLISWGFTYRLTRKYELGFRHRIDLEDNEVRSLDLTLVRKLPRWRLAIVFELDDIDDETFIGFVLIPEGLRTSGYSNRLLD